MKKLLLPFCLLFFMISLPGQETLQRHFGAPSNYDAIEDIVMTPDGQYLVTGTTANYGAEGFDMLFEKIDTTGNLLWQKTWGSAYNDGVNSTIRVSTGGYLVCGYTGGASPELHNFVVVRLDETGEEVWTLERGNSYKSEAISAFELADGGFIIAGHWVNSAANGQITVLIRTDADGNVLWEQYQNLTVVNDIVKAAIATGNPEEPRCVRTDEAD